MYKSNHIVCQVVWGGADMQITGMDINPIHDLSGYQINDLYPENMISQTGNTLTYRIRIMASVTPK